MTLVLRTVKGSPLTYQELDDNFTYLSSSITNISGSGGGFPYTGSADISGSFSLIGSASLNGPVILEGSSNTILVSSSTGVNEITLNTPFDGTKARFTTIAGVNDWAAFTINAAYDNGWNLDKTESIGGFFKLDARDAYQSISFYTIPTGSNPHIDESYILDINLNNKIVSIASDGALNSPNITGSLLGTASYALNAESANAFPYTGSAGISGSLLINGSGSSILKINGTQGELFNVNDSLSGSLFSVNNISGFPQLETFSDGVTKLGNYTARTLYHTAYLTSSAANVSHSVYSFSTSSYNSAFFEYVAISASNVVVGNIKGAWAGSNIVYTDVSSSAGNPTPITLSLIISQSQAQLILLSSGSSWEFKTIIKAI